MKILEDVEKEIIFNYFFGFCVTKYSYLDLRTGTSGFSLKVDGD